MGADLPEIPRRERPTVTRDWTSRRVSANRSLDAGDVLDTPPYWAQKHELQEALNQIRGQHARRKRRSIIWLALAEATGIPKTEIFRMPGCISQASYYGQWRGRDEHGNPRYTSGLRADPDFARAFDVAVRLAHEWQDAEEAARARQRLRDLEDGRDRLASAAGFAVETLIHVAEESESDETRRKAAVDILTHADEITAPKASQSFVVGKAELQMRDIREKRRRREPDDDELLDASPVPTFADEETSLPAPQFTSVVSVDDEDDEDDDLEWLDGSEIDDQL